MQEEEFLVKKHYFAFPITSHLMQETNFFKLKEIEIETWDTQADFKEIFALQLRKN